MNWYQMEVERWRNSPRVAGMNAAERGIYRELMDCQFMHPEGYLPNCPDSYWQFARCTPEEWQQARAKVLPMFPEAEGGKYRSNDTMRTHWQRAKDRYEVLVRNGQKGGQARAKQLLEQQLNHLPNQTATNCSSKVQADKDLDSERPKDSPEANASALPVSGNGTGKGKLKYTANEDDAFSKVWKHYLEKTERNPKIYTATPERKDKAVARYRECLKKTNGDHEKAVRLMLLAVDNLAANDWNMGRDPKGTGKRYCDFIDHLFKSYMEMEKRWNDDPPAKPRPISNGSGKSLLERSIEARGQQ